MSDCDTVWYLGWQHINIGYIQLLVPLQNLSSDVIQSALELGDRTLWHCFSETLCRIRAKEDLQLTLDFHVNLFLSNAIIIILASSSL